MADKRLALAEEATRYKLILKTTSVLEVSSAYGIIRNLLLSIAFTTKAELASLKVQLDEESLRLSTCKQD